MLGLHALTGTNWETFKGDMCAHLGKTWCD